MASTDRVVIESMVEQTCEILRERIRSGALPPGTRLRQERLAEDLGVSRTPLREALRLLAADGLVELEPNRSAVVSSLNHADRVAFWEARLALEPGAARLAAERRDPGSLDAIDEALRRQRAARTFEEGFAANRAFHLALVAAAGNPHLDRFAEALWVRSVGAAIYRTQALDAVHITAYADQHAAIQTAIAAGAGDLAERLTREHILAAPVPDAEVLSRSDI